jgi:hypothetical protein
MNRDPFGLGVLLYGTVPNLPPGLTVEYDTTTPLLMALTAAAGELAHAGCMLSTFCKNPLHPGPCKGWKKKLGVEAPGALKAINAAHAEKLAASRAKRAEAKSAAEKALVGRQLASPLHAKKATVKHANIILGNDETKASTKAGRVILNKTEIKRYSKIKAAHVNSVRAKHGLPEDPGLEDRLAEAFAEDNKLGKDDNYRAVLRGSAESFGAQLAVEHCHKGNHKECDDATQGALRDHLADAAEHALLTGDDEQLDKALADWDAGKLDLTPAPPKAKIPQTAKGKMIEDANAKAKADEEAAAAAAKPKMTNPGKVPASTEFPAGHKHTTVAGMGLKPGDKVKLHLQELGPEKKKGPGYELGKIDTEGQLVTVQKGAHGGYEFHAADGNMVTGGGVATKWHLSPAEPPAPEAASPTSGLPPVKDVADLTPEEAVAFAGDITEQQWETLTKDAKMQLITKLNKAYGQGLPGSDAAVQKMSALKAVKSTAPAAPAAPAEPEPFNVTKAKELFAGDYDPHNAMAAKKLALMMDMSKEEYDQLGPGEKAHIDALLADMDAKYGHTGGLISKNVAKIHDNLGIGPAPAAAEPDVLQELMDAVPTATGPDKPKMAVDISPDAKIASDYANGFKSGTAKQKLPAYEKVSGEEFKQLPPNTQKLILADLLAMKAKFLAPGKKEQAQQQHDYLSGFMGGGAGAGGGGNPGVEAGGADLSKALDNLHELATITKAPATHVPSAAEMKTNFTGMVDAAGHEQVADFLASGWADNAMKSLQDMHADPLGQHAYPDEAIALAKPALAADIKKKLLGQDGPTPHLDAFAKAKKLGGADEADAFVSGAIHAGNDLNAPAPAEHHAKAIKLTSLWHDAAPGYSKQTMADSEAAIGAAGSMGYDTATFNAWANTEGSKIATGVMGGGFTAIGLNIDDKVELLGAPGSHDVLGAMTAEMQQAVKDGNATVPKGGWVEQFHDALGEAKKASADLAKNNGWAADSPVVQEYKKTIMATKLDELGDKIKSGTPSVHPTGGAGAGGTGGSGSSKVAVGTGTASGFTNDQNQVITGTLKSQGINLSSSAQEVWDNAVAAAAAHQGKDGFPTSLTVLDVLNATDEGHAKNLGVTNSNLLRKKVVDWLGTPAGKKYAEDNSTPKPAIMGKLTGDLSIKLPPGQKVQTLSGPGPYDPKNNGPWTEKNVEQAFKDQAALWDTQPDVPWNTNKHGYHKAGWKTKWTDEQQDGLYSYTLGSSTINNYLRGQTPDGTPVTHASHGTKQAIINIQSAMMPLQEDHLFKRGTGWEQFPPGFRDPEAVKQLIGENITEKAFLSTSVPGGGSAGFGGPVRMEIEAPKGTHGAFVEGLSAFKGGTEQEMLLAAGQVMRVLSVKKDGHQTVVRVRIVTPK